MEKFGAEALVWHLPRALLCITMRAVVLAPPSLKSVACVMRLAKCGAGPPPNASQVRRGGAEDERGFHFTREAPRPATPLAHAPAYYAFGLIWPRNMYFD